MRKASFDRVLDLEWEMFSQVRASRPVACQHAPDSFRSVRGSLFATWTCSMLASYEADLLRAKQQGRNLLTEKYARMDDFIPPLNVNPLIEVIVDIETDWQRQLEMLYPALFERCCRQTDRANNGSDFSVYLRSELETYSETTLDLYYDNVKAALSEGRNLAIEALDQLVTAAGYRDLSEAESVTAAEGKMR
jgi:hypothetical protein